MKFVTYEEFGAVGDGFADDFAAIKRAHDYANENGLPVKADGTRTYRICDTRIDGEVQSVIIKTDTDWCGAKFIIDDTDVGYYDGTGRALKHVFRIASDYDREVIDDPERLAPLAGIGEGTKKINLALGYPALICIYDQNERVFRRYSSTAKNSEVGVSKFEILLIDAEGNVDASTPFMFNYDTITKVEVARLDIKPITISNAKITTMASRVNAIKDGKRAGYFFRGIHINRSYTTLIGIEHYVEGEITTFEHRDLDIRGPHYYGFFAPIFANEVIIKNCVLTGRRYYDLSGTYDFTAERVNIIRLEGCTQSNFELQSEEGKTVYSMALSPISGYKYCWGIGGTNYCKNMEYIDSKLSRFDAHAGLYNGKIINCDINAMELTGKGELLIENSRFHTTTGGRNSFLFLRPDYGAIWDGVLKVRNSTLKLMPGKLELVEHYYINWDFGYPCHFPNIDIENLKLEGLSEGSKVYFLTEGVSAYKEPNMHLPETLNVPHIYDSGATDMKNFNPVIPPEYVKIDIEGDVKVHMTKMPFFDNTDFSKCKKGQIVIDEKYDR